MRPLTFRRAAAYLGHTPSSIAPLLGVSAATTRRWAARGTCRGPAEDLIKLLCRGVVTNLDLARIRADRLPAEEITRRSG